MTPLDCEVPQCAQLFPDDCRWAKALPDTCEAPFPQETALKVQAALGVRQLFAAGRRAAHKALQQWAEETKSPQAGQPLSMPILRTSTGAPLWPPNVVGSISHTSGLALAVVGPRWKYAGLGVDVEKIDRRPNLSLTQKVGSAEECAWMEAPLSGSGETPNTQLQLRASFRLLRMLSAKEAVYKTFFPLSEIYLGFTEAQLWPEAWGFSGRLLKAMGEQAPEGLTFRVLQSVEDGYLLSACSHPQSC